MSLNPTSEPIVTEWPSFIENKLDGLPHIRCHINNSKMGQFHKNRSLCLNQTGKPESTQAGIRNHQHFSIRNRTLKQWYYLPPVSAFKDCVWAPLTRTPSALQGTPGPRDASCRLIGSSGIPVHLFIRSFYIAYSLQYMHIFSRNLFSLLLSLCQRENHSSLLTGKFFFQQLSKSYFCLNWKFKHTA